MKTLNDAQKKLIHALSDGKCHSGTKLGSLLHVSRTAVWKQVKQLIELGLPIQSHPQQGYRLSAPFILLDESSIRHRLPHHSFHVPLRFHLFAAIDSTNRYLKDLPSSNAIEICCAELQTAGRGRFGRAWHSPFGENIYFSLRWRLDADLSRLSGLSLVVSLAVLSALNEQDITADLRIKWPNDVLWEHKKLCGNLIEVVAESNGMADVIIGIGLNVNSMPPHQPLADRDWSALFDITQQHQNRNALIASLIAHLHQYLTTFIEQGYRAFMAHWERVDYLAEQTIVVSRATSLLKGTAKGVNEMGQLLLMDEEGNMHVLSSGDTTLKLD